MKNILRLIRNGGLRFELITRLRHSRISLLFCSFILIILFSFLLINGCSKKNSSDDPVLKGNQAFHAGAVAGYQALGAGISYPFMALQFASPTGSTVRNLSALKSILHSLGATIFKNNSKLSDSPEYKPYLNLYTTGASITGNVGTVNYYSDAAGTKSAGTMSITMPTNITNISDPTSYASYPANITIVVNLTAGNLPCKGNISLSFTGGTGANTMTGTLTLTKVNVVFSINLFLDNQMNTTGSVTITESGATLEITNVKGKVTDLLTCDVKISPYGWTGTGTLDLITGEMKANINTAPGTSTVTSDSLGNLNINYADGTHEVVIHALSGGLTSTSSAIATSITATGGTPQSTTINTAFTSPLIATVKDQSSNPVSGATVTFTAPSSGQSCSFTSGVTTITATTNAQGQAQVTITANATSGNYNVTASVSGVNTTAIFSLTNTSSNSITGYNAPVFFKSSERTITTINNNGQSIGYLPSSTGSGSFNSSVYWSTLTSQPQTLQISLDDSAGFANGLNDNGQIVGYSYGKYYYNPAYYNTSKALYWSSPTAKAQKLAVPKNTYNAYAMSINNSKQIVGYALSSSNSIVPLYWASPTDTAQVLAGSSTPVPGFITSNRQILGTMPIQPTSGQFTWMVWVSPTAQPIALKGLTAGATIYPFSINASGVIVGSGNDTSGQIPVMWADANATPQALPLPFGRSKMGQYYASSINTAGVIVGSVGNGGGGGDCTIWQNGQVQDLAVLSNNFALGEAKLITDNGWILGNAYYGNNQYILIPK